MRVGESQTFTFCGNSQGEHGGRSRCWTCCQVWGPRRPGPSVSLWVTAASRECGDSPPASRASALTAVSPLPLGGHCRAPARRGSRVSRSAGLFVSRSLPVGLAPAPGSEPSSAAGVGVVLAKGSPAIPRGRRRAGRMVRLRKQGQTCCPGGATRVAFDEQKLTQPSS